MLQDQVVHKYTTDGLGNQDYSPKDPIYVLGGSDASVNESTAIGKVK